MPPFSFPAIFATIVVASALSAQDPRESRAAVEEVTQDVQPSAAPADGGDGVLQDAIERLAGLEFSRVRVSGHVQQAFTFNPAGPHDRLNFGRLFDDRSNDYRLNQIMLTVEQAVDSDRCLDWGFKAQVMLGSDARFTVLTGTLDNVTDEPVWPDVVELNATLHWHAGIDWDLELGVYPALCGLESIDATKNVLYSHSYIFNFGVPFKHMGLMLFASVSDDLQLMAGLDRGINTGLDDNNDELALHAALIGKLCKKSLSFTLAAHYGAEDPSSLDGVGGVDVERDRRLILDLATTWSVNDRWTLMADLNYGHEEAPLGIGGASPTWYGAAGYVVFNALDELDLVLRGECFRDDDGFVVAQFANDDDYVDIERGIFSHTDPRTVGGGATAYYALTLGANIRPVDGVLVQIEARWDWAGSTRPFDDSSARAQVTTAVAVTLSF